MFTVKVIREQGTTDVHGCEKYSMDSESPVRLSIFTRGVGWEFVDIGRGDSVFIENVGGKTVHSIRPPRHD